MWFKIRDGTTQTLEMHIMKHKKMSLLIATLFSTPLMAQQAFAQEAQAEPAAQAAAQAAAPAAPVAGEIQQVNVTGIRASVRNALAVKEASNSMVEVIASEDIGKLPDTTIAESLARLPGLSSGLDRGNASQIVARGMGPRFIGATLNGRELASSEPDRAVRFEQFPSESISGATVYKTQNAELVEGGIATSIDLQTVSPLKYNGRQLNFKADVLHYNIAKDIAGADKNKPRVGGIWVDQFLNKTLGAAIAFSYQDQPSVQKNVRHWGFNENNSADLNGDGKIDNFDQTWITEAVPNYSYGLNLGANYKGFDLQVFFQGVQGLQAYNNIKFRTDFASLAAGENWGARTLDAWTPTNTGSTIPAVSLINTNNENRASTYFIENASYMKLRNLQLGYSLPNTLVEKVKLQGIRVYVQAQNVFTVKSKGYTAPDPEVTNYQYPIPRIFTTGLNVTF